MPASKPCARITGLGSYLPEKVLTNQDLEKLVDTNDEWIVTRTGMRERRLAHANEFASDMGAIAAKKAMQAAGITADNVELILVTTMSPDYLTPSTAALIQAEIKAENAAAVDVQAACSGYLYGLSMAKAYIDAGMYRTVLLVAAEKMSALTDYQDRNTCVLFGDGASAAVIQATGPGLAIEKVCLGADGSLADLFIIPAGGTRYPATQETVSQRQHYMRMMGKELFKHAIRRMSNAANTCLEQSGVKCSQLSWMVPHQANERIIDALAKSLEIPDDKIYKTVHKYGNTSASSIAIALDELTKERPINNGEHLLLLAFGAGLTWGASILTQRSS